MNKFVIVDGLPYLLSHGRTLAVRWDEKGFTVGTEVKLASVPDVTYSELSIKAKCSVLDSIGEKPANEADDKPLSEMTLAELKAYAAKYDIKLGGARTKETIIEAIAEALI